MKNVLVIGGGKDLSKMWGGRRRREPKFLREVRGARGLPQENVRKKGDFTPYPRTCVPFSGTGPKNAKINP